MKIVSTVTNKDPQGIERLEKMTLELTAMDIWFFQSFNVAVAEYMKTKVSEETNGPKVPA